MSRVDENFLKSLFSLRIAVIEIENLSQIKLGRHVRIIELYGKQIVL